jgi:mono/diheme cytochrome c family protein
MSGSNDMNPNLRSGVLLRHPSFTNSLADGLSLYLPNEFGIERRSLEHQGSSGGTACTRVMPATRILFTRSAAEESLRMKGKWLRAIGAASIAACITLGIYYADLLAAAFARNPMAHSPESIARGKVVFDRLCVHCHGPAGHGDGPVAASLPARPKDLSGLAPPPIFPDGVVAYRIANGKNLMPPWKSVLSENEIWDVLNFIRSLRPPDKR